MSEPQRRDQLPCDSQGGDSQGGDLQRSDSQGGDSQGGDSQGGDSQRGDSQRGDPQRRDSQRRDPQRRDPQARAHWALSIQAERVCLAPSAVEALIARWLPTPLQLFRHGWLPQGLSLFGSSAQLTLVLHTWPEHGAASLDLFFSDSFDAQQFVAQLTEASGWRIVAAQESPRLVPG